MRLCRWTARFALLGCVLLGLAACSSQPFLNSTPTVYDLTQRPAEFANKDVTVQGFYLWKPGSPSTSVLVPGLSTADDVRDAQPIYASVECASNGSCKPSTTAIGTASTGAIWLDGFPADVTANLHAPGDSVWGVVEVTGHFENAGGYGPDKGYHYRMQVKSARPLEKIERLVETLPKQPLGEGKVAFTDLVTKPEQYAGKQVTTQAFYYWSPATSGLLAEGVTSEKTPQNKAGLNPMPAGKRIALDGFPPNLSSQINVGENNTFVWGLIEVTGTFETNGSWGPNGELKQHLTIKDGRVKVLEPKK